MTDPRFERICDLTRSLMKRLPIPGVSLGVYAEGQEKTAGFGVTSIDNPLPVTPDTLFQVGSITKTFVATAAMRLVEMGRLDLDLPITDYLTGLRMADPDTQARVTFRHLVSHTGGWLGDYFNDFGPGGEALQRMVEEVGRLPQITPLGELYSYNNAGFYLAGRVIEVLTGKPFEEAIQELILAPLEMRMSFFFAEQVMTYRFASGHELVERQPRVARPWGMGRACYPAGALVSNVPDLFRYARFHMGDGKAPGGTQLLSRSALEEMRVPRFPSTGLNWMGLSWFVIPAGDVQLVGHGGATNGQQAAFRFIPEQGFAVAVLTNSDEGSSLTNEVLDAAAKEFCGIVLPSPQPVPLADAQRSALLGVYDSALGRLELTARENGELTVQVTHKGGFPTPSSPPSEAPPPLRAAVYDGDRLVVLEEPMKGARGEFIRGADGQVVWLRLSGRLHRKIS